MKIDNFIINRKDAILLIIDIQEKLFAAMQAKIQNLLIKNSSILIETAKLFNIPIIVSEQYSKGLGPSIEALADKFSGSVILEKIHFDCMQAEALNNRIKELGKRTVIIPGIESHICVFQTAITLLQEGYKVVIPSDAIASRRKHDWQMAIAELRQAGAVVYPTETISFMILEKAGTAEFKALAPMFK